MTVGVGQRTEQQFIIYCAISPMPGNQTTARLGPTKLGIRSDVQMVVFLSCRRSYEVPRWAEDAITEEKCGPQEHGSSRLDLETSQINDTIMPLFDDADGSWHTYTDKGVTLKKAMSAVSSLRSRLDEVMSHVCCAFGQFAEIMTISGCASGTILTDSSFRVLPLTLITQNLTLASATADLIHIYIFWTTPGHRIVLSAL